MDDDPYELRQNLDNSADCYNKAIKGLSEKQIILVDKAIDSAIKYDRAYNSFT